MKNRQIRAADANYSNYRIPGIVVTKKHTVITYFEARRSMSDWAHMDILLYRSEDGGETFSDAIVMARGSDAFPTVNNPVCIVDADNTLHFLYCRNYTVGGGGVFYRCSKDDGITWSEPRSITEATKPEIHNVYACGPGHGIETREGLLLVPVWMVKRDAGVPLTEHHPGTVSTLYSADHGNTWHSGEEIPGTPGCPDPSETQAALLSDGSIYMTVRTTAAGCRAFTVGQGGCGGWKPLAPDTRLPDPTCFGSTASAWIDGRHVLAVVNCADRQTRTNLVCRLSFDDGETWSKTLTVEAGDAGYADIALTDDGTFYVLYEQSFGTSERLAIFSLSDFT